MRYINYFNMKQFYFLLFSLISIGFANAQEPFITTWQVQGNNLSIVVPVIEDDDIPDSYTIDFGDGTILTNQSGSSYHNYDNAGIYTVTVSGNFSRIKMEPYHPSEKILSVEQWGDVQWTSMKSAFSQCNYLSINATDVPNLSQVTDMSFMFTLCNNFDSPIGNWDVSNVNNMSYMFNKCQSFNQSLNSWDVSNVTNMKGMFNHCENFNQPLNDWNVGNVTNMAEMLSDASSFNQPLSNWDTSNVTNMESMFSRASSFNQPLNNWNVGNVTNMESMFSEATAFNQPLNNWNVGNVTTMESMFSRASSFNQPVNSWDTSNVTNMKGMFVEASSFNQPVNSWNISNVLYIRGMFRRASSFNQSLNNWNVGNVTNMESMFSEATAFNQPLNNWDVSGIIYMTRMFSGASSFNQPLNNWDVSNVTSMKYMFYDATSFNQDISAWHFNNDLQLHELNYPISGFIRSSGLDTSNYDALLNRFAQLGLENKNLGAYGVHFCDYGVREYLINELGWIINDSGLDDNCQNNILSGTVLFDDNNNSCDIDDYAMTGFVVNGNNNTYNYATNINSDGTYNLNLFDDTYEISILNLPDYFIVTPQSSTITFTDSNTEQQLNFCIIANQTIEDLNITILPVNEARPGFESEYQLILENLGTQTVASAAITVTFDETLQTFLSAEPQPTATTANQLSFTVDNLLPFQNSIINFTMETFTPPTVNGGEIANFTATVTPDANDNTPDDNTYDLAQTIVNSFDPNDKRVLQGEEITLDQTDDYLNYIIRFQNTGTASAINVRVVDTLHQNLDWNTFRMINASHDYNVEITNGNHVEFIFNNINLPHEDADAEGSNGFIAYKIKPVGGLQIGDIITGDAEIYFDYNLPIITNMATTEVVEVLKVNEYSVKSSITVYPNPTKDKLYINTPQNIQVKEIQIYNLQGRQLMAYHQSHDTVNIESLTTGVYIMVITTDKGVAKYKLVKE